jgi:hypothetical protein
MLLATWRPSPSARHSSLRQPVRAHQGPALDRALSADVANLPYAGVRRVAACHCTQCTKKTPRRCSAGSRHSSVLNVRKPPQSDVSSPQSTALHRKVRQVTPATPKIGCGHSSIRSSLPRPQLGQIGRCSSSDGAAAARCVSLIILISCYASARVERIAGNQAELATASA